MIVLRRYKCCGILLAGQGQIRHESAFCHRHAKPNKIKRFGVEGLNCRRGFSVLGLELERNGFGPGQAKLLIAENAEHNYSLDMTCLCSGFGAT